MAERGGEQFDLAGEQRRAPDDLTQGGQRGVGDYEGGGVPTEG